ncbi:MAG: hypothetical protein AB1424_04355 [Thermodesulfobacteriota bacterium]
MKKRVLWLSLIVSMGILLGIWQIPAMLETEAMADRGGPGTGPHQEGQKELVVAAALKGAVEKRTPEYTVAPPRKPDQSASPKVGVAGPPEKEKKEKREGEKRGTPKPSSPVDRTR